MAGSPETRSQKLTERFVEGTRNLFIVGALVGLIAIMANMSIGGPIFEAGAIGAGGSEAARRLIGPKKK